MNMATVLNYNYRPQVRRFVSRRRTQKATNIANSRYFMLYSEEAHCIKDSVKIDPCCGSGGFFLACQDFLTDSNNYTLDREQKELLKKETFYGNEIVPATFKTALMNLYLHNIGDIYGNVPITLGDALLTNPPFGKKSSITITNEDDEQEK